MTLFDGPHYRWAPGRCANCEADLVVTPSISLLCGDYCKEWAKHVRYFRSAEADGRAFTDPLVAEAMRTRLAHLVAGGYPDRDRRLPDQIRREVLARNGGLCVACGERPAAEVDHIDGSSPDPANLQGLCHSCHQAKTESHFVLMDDQDRAVRDAFLDHVRESEPVMLAHDACWAEEWRQLHRQNLDLAQDGAPTRSGLCSGTANTFLRPANLAWRPNVAAIPRPVRGQPRRANRSGRILPQRRCRRYPACRDPGLANGGVAPAYTQRRWVLGQFEERTQPTDAHHTAPTTSLASEGTGRIVTANERPVLASGCAGRS